MANQSTVMSSIITYNASTYNASTYNASTYNATTTSEIPSPGVDYDSLAIEMDLWYESFVIPGIIGVVIYLVLVVVPTIHYTRSGNFKYNCCLGEIWFYTGFLTPLYLWILLSLYYYILPTTLQIQKCELVDQTVISQNYRGYKCWTCACGNDKSVRCDDCYTHCYVPIFCK